MFLSQEIHATNDGPARFNFLSRCGQNDRRWPAPASVSPPSCALPLAACLVIVFIQKPHIKGVPEWTQREADSSYPTVTETEKVLKSRSGVMQY
jgi:hypothetical protein